MSFKNGSTERRVDWRNSLLFPILVALATLGLGGGFQFLIWGGSVSAKLEQLDDRLAALDERLQALYPRREADSAYENIRNSLARLSEQQSMLRDRVSALERSQP